MGGTRVNKSSQLSSHSQDPLGGSGGAGGPGGPGALRVRPIWLGCLIGLGPADPTPSGAPSEVGASVKGQHDGAKTEEHMQALAGAHLRDHQALQRSQREIGSDASVEPFVPYEH